MQQQITKSKRMKPVPEVKEESVEQSKTKILHWLVENPYLAQRELNNRKFYYFVRWAWSEVSSEVFVPNWHIEYICGRLQEAVERVGMGLPRKKDILINITPGSSKTTIVLKLLNVWCWTRWYWMKFIAGSWSFPLALESAEASRDLIRSDKFQMIYPEFGIKDDKDQLGNFRVIKKIQVSPGRSPQILFGGSRYTTSVGTSPMGFHGHVLLWDDASNPKQAQSKTKLDDANNWIDEFSTRKVNKEVALMIGIQQRLHQNDTSAHLLKKHKDRIEHICIPGEIFEGSENVKPQELVKFYKDGLMDPVRLSRQSLADLQSDLGQYGYSAQVLQTPTPATGGMFKVDHFSLIERMPPEVDVLEIVRYWDKAGTKEQADGKGKMCYTVGTKMARLVRNQFVVMDVIRGRWASEEREDLILSTAKSDGVSVKIYYEQEPGSGGKQSAEATTKNLTGFTGQADLPHGDKVYRADPFSVSVNNGQVSLLKGEWNKDYMEEFRFFPFSTYKDQVDASSGAYSKLTGSKQVEIYGRR
jgi:predicted phage terminase large subunit-like protein